MILTTIYPQHLTNEVLAMSSKIAGHGRLSSQPQARNTKSGITMTACFMYLTDTAQAEDERLFQHGKKGASTGVRKPRRIL